MKKQIVRPLTICLCGALVVGGIGVTAQALGNNNIEEAAVTKVLSEDDAEVKKDESVYVITESDGTKQQVIVSDWLKSPAGDTYTKETVEKEIPIELTVSYRLNGTEIAPEELAGKSGHVTIRYQYANHQKEIVMIDGKQEEMVVPFAVLTGALLDNEVFRNVTVSSGKVLNDGDRTFVIGLSLPGMQDNLDLDKGYLEIPDYVEITADVTDFEMSDTLTIATNEVFRKLDIDKMDSIEDVKDSLNELTSAMVQLTDGSSELYKGLQTLQEKSGELVDGVDQLTTGADALKEGAESLAAGVAQIQGGAGKLSTGAAQLSAGAGELVIGAGNLAEGMESLQSGAGQLSAGATELSGGLQKLTANNDSLTGGAQQIFGVMLGTATVQLKEAGMDIPELTMDNYEVVLNQIDQKLSAVVSSGADAVTVETSKAGLTAVRTLKAQLDAYNTFYQGLVTYTAGVLQAAEGAVKLEAGVGSLKNGADALKDGSGALIAGIGSVKDGADTLKSGIDTLKTGTDSLKNGSESLAEGSDALAGGLHSLQEGSATLVNGVEQLCDGAKRLSEGLNEFDEKGVQKIVSAMDGDLSKVVDRFRESIYLAQNYQSFSEGDEMGGQVKFIYRTEPIEKAE